AYFAALSRHSFPTRRSSDLFDRVEILNLGGGGMSCGDRVVRELAHELFDRRFRVEAHFDRIRTDDAAAEDAARQARDVIPLERLDRKSTRLNSSHQIISYAV